MIIYDNNNITILDITVDDNSYRHRVIMGENSLTLHYSLAEHIDIPVGSYCLYQGVKYSLERPEQLKMKHSRKFEYTVILEASEAKAKIWKFRNTVDGRLKFALTAKPSEHLQMFVDNMNRRDKGWTVGECIDGVETLILYDHLYNLEALTQMASELKTEYEFNGKCVSLKKIEYNKNNPLPLSYGRNNGLRLNVGRSNYGDNIPPEILFVQGGSENIDTSKYGNAELLLPKNQSIKYDGDFFEDEEGFNLSSAREYIVDDLGLSIRRKDKPFKSFAEDSLDCSDNYPKRVGQISSVVAVDKNKNFYDFIDSSIPESLNYSDCLIAGESMTVIFQSGMLAGREFEVKYYHNESKITTQGGTKKSARRFEIVPAELDGQTMPNEIFAPRAGDLYAVFKCQLPDAYICDNKTKSGASWDMFRSAVKYLFDNEEHKFTFTGELDGIWSKKDWLNISGRLKLGGYILFSDTRFQNEGTLVRITGIKDYINNPYSPELELSNSTVSSGFSSSIKKLESEDVLIEDKHQQSVQFTKRRFRDAKETMSMIEEALLDNFSNSINPIVVQTMSMLIGDESLQFRFVDNITKPEQVNHQIIYDNANKQLLCTAGIIQHLTLGITSVSSSHSASEYRYWNIPEYKSGKLEDTKAKYYVYTKVSKIAQTGNFLISEKAIKMDDGSGFYHLLIGVLNSEYDGERSFARMYGFTEVLPGQVRTDRLVSGDGNSYFDMLANALKLGDVFDFNSNGDKKLRLKGTIIQSESGAEEYIGCFRGIYNSSYIYYRGDEVTYTTNKNTSTYRFIYPIATLGKAPTDSIYWQIIAQGSKGEDGTSVKILGSFDNESQLPPSGNIIGDGYIINGYLYVWNGTKWENVGVIKGDKGDDGDPGKNADYYELRYSVNGSISNPPQLSKSSLTPKGWNLLQPTISAGQYLWMTIAKKTADGKSLLQQWSTPVRITPYDGSDGKNGESPVMVYRGIYQKGKTYYGNKSRLDAVKSGNTYYIARIDAGIFSSIAPPDSTKWNNFGASFESIATNLLLAEGANIGDWFISGGKIVSTLDTKDIISLDAKNNRIRIFTKNSNALYQEEIQKNVTIDLNASSGLIEVRGDTGVSYMSPTGIFANRAGTQCVSATTGYDQRAAIVGLGFGNLDKWDYSFNRDERLIAGVYGNSSNTGTAPSYGGYFFNLKAKGLVLGTKYIEESYVYLDDSVTLAVGFTNEKANVFLPASSREGQTIFFKQWWTGYMRLYARNGQKIYDDSSENAYYDVGQGQELVAHFVRASINGESVQVWIVSKFKF